MTVIERTPKLAECTHDGIHGPDSEPGAVQRCHEETILIRAQQSREGRALRDAIEQFQDTVLPAYEARIVRETMRLAEQVGALRTVVMEPDDDYGRTKPWDPEGIED